MYVEKTHVLLYLLVFSKKSFTASCLLVPGDRPLFFADVGFSLKKNTITKA
uniref:Uncharacterized protein n=1 Tax=viral metagenome TaxID=1070528 RepID=A0A6C0BRF5_9ZZZZ